MFRSLRVTDLPDPLLSLRNSRASDISWGKTTDRAARTSKARRAFEDRFLKLADGDPQRAESLRKAHFKNIQLKSIAARKAKREAEAARAGHTTKPSRSSRR